MAAFTTIALVAVAAVGAFAAVQQGKAAEKSAKFQASIQEQQAAREREASAQSERDFRREQKFFMARRKAALGARGVVPTTGSPLLGTADFEREAELQALRIREGGEIRGTRLEQQAQLNRMAGSNARTAANFRAGSSLLTGAGRAFG